MRWVMSCLALLFYDYCEKKLLGYCSEKISEKLYILELVNMFGEKEKSQDV